MQRGLWFFQVFMLIITLIIPLFLIFGVVRASSEEITPELSAENTHFELWLRKTFDHTGIYHGKTHDTVFLYVNENWHNGANEWRFKAIRRLGCAARREYADELTLPYMVEILVFVPQPSGSVVTETVAAGNINNETCAFDDFFPMLSPAKETAL